MMILYSTRNSVVTGRVLIVVFDSKFLSHQKIATTTDDSLQPIEMWLALNIIQRNMTTKLIKMTIQQYNNCTCTLHMRVQHCYHANYLFLI